MFYIALAALAIRFSEYVLPGYRLLGIHVSVSGLVASVILLGGCLAWITRVPPHISKSSLKYYFISLLALWISVEYSAYLLTDPHDSSALLFPLMIVLVWIRPPSLFELRTIQMSIAWAIVILYLVAVSLYVGGVVRPDDPDTTYASSRIDFGLHIFQHLRWPGPFGSLATAAVMGGFLIICALFASKTIERSIFLLMGLVIIGMAESRAGILAVVLSVSIIVFSASKRKFGIHERRRIIFWGIVSSVTLLCGVVIYTQLNGRAEIWDSYISAISTIGAFGIGTIGIGQRIDSGEFESYAGHAHNIFLDVLVRNGFVPFFILIFFVAIQVTQVLKVRRNTALPLALTSLVLITNFFEVTVSWIDLSFELWLLIFAFLYALRTLPDSNQVTIITQITEKNVHR
jgi:hypothetical protein